MYQNHFIVKISWYSNVNNLLQFLDIDIKMLEKNKSELKRHIYRKLKLKYDNLWRSEINHENKKFGNKLRTYCSFDNNIILEKYLLILIDEQRVLYTKFRISAHKLEIEKGRYIGLKVEDRICQLCKDDIEDEVHFLLQCPYLQKKLKAVR